MNNNLKVLAEPKNHDNLLLAEAVAWLHDMGKCDERHLQQSALDHTGPKPYKYKTEHSHLVGMRRLELLGESVPFKYLIEKGIPSVAADPKVYWLVRVLGYCHSAAHAEKEEAYYLLQQTIADTRCSSPFGYESEPLVDLKVRLYGLPFSQISNRSTFEASVEKAFSYAIGDTRRPINEVTLWDWSSIVAAFYKAALAAALLGYKEVPPDIHWRLLSVRFSGSSFSERVARIPDLLVRQKLISDGLNRVCTLLEETYPLGTEVYRDEDGSVFIVPNVDDLLTLENEQGEKLSILIVREFSAGTIDDRSFLQLGGEVIPSLELDKIPWSRQGPQIISKYQHQPPLPIANHVMEVPPFHTDSQIIGSWWLDYREDICTVCQLRPQGWGAPDYKVHYHHRVKGEKCPSRPVCQTCKALERRVCAICEQRREDRSKQWTQELGTTVWIDEVADVNGRLALVVGKFDLEHWLDGKMLFYPNNQGEMIEAQTPARLHRVWETTQKFWEGIKSNFKTTVGQIKPRLRIRGTFIPEASSRNTLGVFHTYELKLANVNLSITSIADGEFITVDNLQRIAVLLGALQEFSEDYSTAADYVINRLQPEDKSGQGFEVEEPTGYGSPNKLLGRLRIERVDLEDTPYVPAVPILIEPSIFMAIVPANRAIKVVKAFKKKYEEEMGKVRNRLPLTMGIVFAGRRTPLPAILDAGRRMLKQPTTNEFWTVEKVDRSSLPKEVGLTMEKGELLLSITVPTVMGDGTTEDVWYPYWQVENDKDGPIKPFSRTRQFTGLNGEEWVHICDLKEDDVVHFVPSRFDFEFLDTAARRFEISYDNDKRRGSYHPSRPYYLEQFEDFDKESIWKTFSDNLAASQIENLVGIIETKRMEWAAHQDKGVFERMVRDVLNNANWKPRPEQEKFDQLYSAALNGQLADVAEMYIRILKGENEPIKGEKIHG